MRSISINLRKNENVIKVQENAEQKNIIKELKQKLPDLKNYTKKKKFLLELLGKH